MLFNLLGLSFLTCKIKRLSEEISKGLSSSESLGLKQMPSGREPGRGGSFHGNLSSFRLGKSKSSSSGSRPESWSVGKVLTAKLGLLHLLIPILASASATSIPIRKPRLLFKQQLFASVFQKLVLTAYSSTMSTVWRALLGVVRSMPCTV